MNLRRVIAEYLATSPIADPHINAEHILKRIDDTDLRDALAQALPHFVSQVMWSAADRATRPVGTTTSARWTEAETAYRHRERVAAMRVEVGEEARDWKFLADCTRDEVLRAAAYRRKLASENIAKATRFEQLAKAMKQLDVETVADLPDDALGEFFS